MTLSVLHRHHTSCVGPVDPAKTTFINQPHWLVLTAGTYYSMMVAPRDSFGNPANITQDLLTVHVRKVKNQVMC